jgi:hypothetical protein
LREEEDGAPRPHWRAPSTRPRWGKSIVIGYCEPVA